MDIPLVLKRIFQGVNNFLKPSFSIRLLLVNFTVPCKIGTQRKNLDVFNF